MKKSIVLSLSDEELFDLERIMLDSDGTITPNPGHIRISFSNKEEVKYDT